MRAGAGIHLAGEAYTPAAAHAWPPAVVGHCVPQHGDIKGVEAETLACGTGVVAAAIITRALGLTADHVIAGTRGGETLGVYIESDEADSTGVRLEGPAALVYRAQLTEETIRGG